jgi:hypothetical protein
MPDQGAGIGFEVKKLDGIDPMRAKTWETNIVVS